MPQISFQDILQRLGPNPPGGDQAALVWSLFLYGMFFLTLICFFNQRIPVMVTTLMLAGAMLCMIIDKVGVGNGPNYVLPSNNRADQRLIFTLFMRIAMFGLPVVAASQSKTEKSRKWGYMAAGLGFVYFIVRGFVDFQFMAGK